MADYRSTTIAEKYVPVNGVIANHDFLYSDLNFYQSVCKN